MDNVRNLAEAARALESTLVKQLLESSGAFKGNGVAGSGVHAQMFMEVLADAVTKDGGFGLAKMLEKSLAPPGSPEGEAAGHPSANGLPHPGQGSSLSLPAALPAAPAPSHGAGIGAGIGSVTSDFGERVHPIDGTLDFHAGIDLRAPEGAPIHAAMSGIVRSAGPRGGYGNAVEIDHGGGVSTLYAHASTLSVKPGDVVSAGESLGEVGQTGKTTGPHLHFEVRTQGKAIDPKKALNAYGIRAEATLEESRKQASKSP
jgi:murein DD-endopeptidase MepM/ murein hydrolase activator NlpD